MVFPKNPIEGSPDFELKSASLCCDALCVALIQLVITLSFQLRIVICLKPWIREFLNFKIFGEIRLSFSRENQSMFKKGHKRLPLENQSMFKKDSSCCF